MRLIRRFTLTLCAAALAASLPAASTPSVSAAPSTTNDPPPATVTAHAPAAAVAGEDFQSVYRLYKAYFLREPDAPGLAHWHGHRSRGMPLAQISEYFAQSPEFTNRYGRLDNAGFVNLVYRNVLGRDAEPAGFAHWVGHLHRGLTRGGMMIGFSDSLEYKNILAKPPAPKPPAPPSSGVGPGGVPIAPPGMYAFTLKDGSTPVQWDPCGEIRVVANFEGAPAGSSAALKAAIAHLTETHKIRWVYEGVTTERYDNYKATFARPHTDVARYGNRYVPVLVTWPRSWADSTAAGYGGFSTIPVGGKRQIVTGAVALSPEYRRSVTQLTNLMLHEFAHVANLAHVNEQTQIMYPRIVGLDRFQNGDRAGLAQVGGWNKRCSAIDSPDRVVPTSHAVAAAQPSPMTVAVEPTDPAAAVAGVPMFTDITIAG